jgi:hypothetical protein
LPAKFDLDKHGKILPDPQDIDAVKDTPDDPSRTRVENEAYKYQLAQARQLIRLYELGQLTVELMRDGKTDKAKATSVAC